MTESLKIREATDLDLKILIRMLAEDDLGKQREYIDDGPLNPAYARAFKAIQETPNHSIFIAELDDEIVGTFELSFIPGLTYQGRWRAQIEAVRVDPSLRGRGIGGEMIRWAIEQARQRDCCLVQLTSDKRRVDALRFYQAQGFQPSHEGFKLRLLSGPTESDGR